MAVFSPLPEPSPVLSAPLIQGASRLTYVDPWDLVVGVQLGHLLTPSWMAHQTNVLVCQASHRTGINFLSWLATRDTITPRTGGSLPEPRQGEQPRYRGPRLLHHLDFAAHNTLQSPQGLLYLFGQLAVLAVLSLLVLNSDFPSFILLLTLFSKPLIPPRIISRIFSLVCPLLFSFMV